MKQIDVISESAELLAMKLSTKLRDTMMCRIILAFRDKPVSQKEMGKLFGLSEAYISRAVRQYRAEHMKGGL